MHSRVLGVFSALLLIVLTSLVAEAQTGRASVTGHVVDSGGAVLPGARVELQPGGLSTASDNVGQFTFSSVPSGNYTITVKYVGFADFSQQITVSAGSLARVDASLKVASKSEEVVVTTERGHGEAEAINVQRESDNILQVLPVEVITSLPNTNIADAVGRLPSVTLERDEGEGKYVQIRGAEPRYNNVTIDGVELASPETVRQIKLDLVPANLIDSVEVNKTLSANQDGDAIGGSVNLVTKRAEEKPTFYINGIGGYTPILGGRSLTEIDGTVGQRFGQSKKLGILFGASYDWNGRGINDVEPVPVAIPCGGGCANPNATAPFFTTYQTEDIRNYRYNRTRYGYTGNIDYKLGDVSGVYARFLYSHFDNFGDRWLYTPSTNPTTDPNGNPLTTGWLSPTMTDGNASMSANVQARRPVQVIGSLAAGGKHDFSPWLLIYEISASRAATEDQGYSSADFGNGNSYQFTIDPNIHTPRFIAQPGVNVFDQTQYTLSDIDFNHTYSPQLNLGASFSVARTYNAGGHFGTFEFGFKFRNAHKFEDAFDPAYNFTGGNDPLLSSFDGSFSNSSYYDGRYPGSFTAKQADYGKVVSFFNANQAAFTLDQAGTALNTYGSNFDLIERVTAGYAMNTIQFGRVRVQTGLRFEATNENILGNQVAMNGNGNPTFSPLTRNNSYLDPLPSAQVRFALGQDSDLRVSYGRGIARPNFGDLPPSFDVTNVIPNQPNGKAVGFGNPDLKPTHSNNFDVLFEQYLKPFGVIQGGFFYKQLSDPIYESVESVITSATAQQNPLLSPYVGDLLSQPINGSSAHLYGVEIAYQQHLTFLPGFLNGFGLSANYGYTKSQASGIPLRTDKPALQRQAPSTFNFSPTYDKGRFSARLGLSYNGANIFSYLYQNQQADPNSPNGVSPVQVPLGIKGPFGDTYLLQHTQVDAQVSFRLYRGMQFIFSGLNLTNEVFGFYNGSPIYPIQREYYKPSYELGLRYTLASENK